MLNLLLSALKKMSGELVTKLVEDASTQTEVIADKIVTSMKDLVDCQNYIKDLLLKLKTYENFFQFSFLRKLLQMKNM